MRQKPRDAGRGSQKRPKATAKIDRSRKKKDALDN